MIRWFRRHTPPHSAGVHAPRPPDQHSRGGVVAFLAMLAVVSGSVGILTVLLTHLALNEEQFGQRPERIAFNLTDARGEEVSGRDLAAVAASNVRLQLGKVSATTKAAEQPSWRIRALSSDGGERLAIRSGGASEWQELRSVVLTPGMHLAIGQLHFFVQVDSDGALMMVDGTGQTWRYDGTELARPDSGPATCPQASVPQRFASGWNASIGAVVPRARLARALVFGGSARCGLRIPIDARVGRSVRIDRDGAQYRLRALTADGMRMVRTQTAVDIPGASAGWMPLANADQRLSEGDRLLVGKSSYLVTRGAEGGSGDLLLIPLGRTQKLNLGAAPQNSIVRWTLRPASPLWEASTAAQWVGAGVATLWLLAIIALVLRTARDTRKPVTARLREGAARLAAASLTALLGLGLIGRGLGLALGVGWMLGVLIATVFASGLWALAGRRWPIAMALPLLAVGVLIQAELGISAPHTAGMLQTHTLASVSVIAITSCVLLAWWVPAMVERVSPWQRGRVLDIAVWTLTAVALGLLGVQVLQGDELGVWGIQPVELCKFALVCATAHLLAHRLRWVIGRYDTPTWQLWLRLAAPLALLLALIGASLWLLDDFSPFVLLAFWALGTLLMYLAAINRPALAGMLAIVTMVLAGWVVSHPPEVLALLNQLDFYGDRLRVWAQPELHPFTGEQLGRAQALAAEGGRWGRLGEALAPFGVWRIPAVLDDFAPSVAVLLLGAVGAVALWVLQGALVLALLWRALQELGAARAATGDYVRAHWHHFNALACAGGALLLLGHIVISWGTNTGLTPVMGQPMPWISAAGSHLLTLVWPVVMLGSLGSQRHADRPAW